MRHFALTSLALFAFFAYAVPSQAQEEKVALDKVPQPVLAAVKARFPSGKVTGAEKEKEKDATVYEIAVTDKGHNVDVTVNAAGKIVEIEQQLTDKDLPKAVTSALTTKYPKSTHKTVESVTKVSDGKEKLEYYEVTLSTAQGKKLEVEVARSGKVLKEEDKSKEKDESAAKSKEEPKPSTAPKGSLKSPKSTTGTNLQAR